MFEFLKIIISLLIWILVFYSFKFLSKRNLKLVIVFNLCIYVYGILYLVGNTFFNSYDEKIKNIDLDNNRSEILSKPQGSRKYLALER